MGLSVTVGMAVEVTWTVGIGVVSGNTAVEVGAVAVEVTVVPWPPQATKMPSTATISKDASRMHRLPNPPTYFSSGCASCYLLERAAALTSRITAGSAFFSI